MATDHTALAALMALISALAAAALVAAWAGNRVTGWVERRRGE